MLMDYLLPLRYTDHDNGQDPRQYLNRGEILREWMNRRHDIHLVDPHSLRIGSSEPMVRTMRLTRATIETLCERWDTIKEQYGNDEPFRRLTRRGCFSKRPVARADCVYPMFFSNVPSNMRLLGAYEHVGVTPVVSTRGFRRYHNKAVVTETLGDLLPETYVYNSIHDLNDVASGPFGQPVEPTDTAVLNQPDDYRWVLKKLGENAGSGVWLFPDNFTDHCDDRRQSGHRELINRACKVVGTPGVMQAYLPDVTQRGDHRVLIGGGRIFGAYNRQAASDDFRTNICQNGNRRPERMTKTEWAIARQVADRIGDDVLLAGIDIGADHLLEVNLGYPGGIKALRRLYDEPIVETIVDCLEAQA